MKNFQQLGLQLGLVFAVPMILLVVFWIYLYQSNKDSPLEVGQCRVNIIQENSCKGEAWEIKAQTYNIEQIVKLGKYNALSLHMEIDCDNNIRHNYLSVGPVYTFQKVVPCPEGIDTLRKQLLEEWLKENAP